MNLSRRLQRISEERSWEVVCNHNQTVKVGLKNLVNGNA
nr:MAG TPA: hypothetical protein [Caudoviricetes sp.]